MAVVFLTVGSGVSAQTNYTLDNVIVRASRPMKEIGVQKTAIDSAMLKESVALSMADVLTFNSPVFVKSYGRATQSTVTFRGTSPGHTQVTWNGMKINSPLLGTTDFSTIPSYFIDNATLLYGSSSVTSSGGGLGGLVSLSSSQELTPGVHLQYVQGVGSFKTFDEFARIGWANEHWSILTRGVYSSSANDYKYINHDKKNNIYDDNHNIIGQYYPEEHNRSGAFRDMHLLQEVTYNTLRGDRLGLKFWATGSNRELPLLTTDYGDERDFENRQREHTFRAIISWDHTRSRWSANLKGGYVNTYMAYDFRRDGGNGQLTSMTRSRSRVNTLYGQGDFSYSPTRRVILSASLSAHQHFVKSRDKDVIVTDEGRTIMGYDKARIEFSGALSAKWQPIERLGLSTTLRYELSGEKTAPVIPALFADYLLVRDWNLMLKASASRNYRFPSLNDLYFMPGGNPKLKTEKGITYDAGVSFDRKLKQTLTLGGSATWFDSRIDDWIIWLPTTRGFFSPSNVKSVHSYGVEISARSRWDFHKDCRLELNANYSFTPSVNRSGVNSEGDKSVGKQLPYIPRNSASLTGRLTIASWSLLYKWVFYSRRYTMTSGENNLSGSLPNYFMNNISLEKRVALRPADLSLKLAVNNLFNEEYLSVLSRPMPGINFEFFVSITPKFHKKRGQNNY